MGWLGAVAAALALPVVATGQNSWMIDIRYSDPAGVINSLDDTATVTIWAAWDPANYAFLGSELNVNAADPWVAGSWSGNIALLRSGGFRDGTIEGSQVRDIKTVQLHLPDAGIYADPANPIAAWTATWRTSELTLRSIPVTTDSKDYWLYLNEQGQWSDLIDSLDEGVGVINVVPAPGACALVGVAVVAMTRGKRFRVPS